MDGDALARQCIGRAARYLGIGVLNLIHLVDPALVIIGGGVSKIGELLFDPVRTLVQERGITSQQRQTPIVPAALGDQVGLLGGVALVPSQDPG
jgi:predicted NBD/HSP70 family sugar kinase